MGTRLRTIAAATAAMALLTPTAAVAGGQRDHSAGSTPSMLTPADGWDASTVFTVGDSVRGYTPPGVLDGVSVAANRGRVIAP